MNVNTYDTKPLHEEIIHVGHLVRVFDDRHDDHSLWFELESDKFWCGDDRQDAVATRDRTPTAVVRLTTLREAFPKGTLTSE